MQSSSFVFGLALGAAAGFVPGYVGECTSRRGLGTRVVVDDPAGLVHPGLGDGLVFGRGEGGEAKAGRYMLLVGSS